MLLFFSGVIFAAFLLVGAIFLKFFFHSRDRFFAIFSMAFLLMSVERFLIVFLEPNAEVRSNVYIIRLIAFLFIIAAIVDKNRETKVNPKTRQDSVDHFVN